MIFPFFRPRPSLLNLSHYRRIRRYARRNQYLATSRGIVTQSSEPFKILYFGRDEFSCGVFEKLYAAKDVWQSISIVTQPDEKVGRRGSRLSISPLKVLGELLDLPVHTIPHAKKEFKTWPLPEPFLTPLPTHLLLTASFGRILSSRHLSPFLPHHRLNVHPSLLPLYRGAAPIQRALIDGRKETGVCVIEMMEAKKGIDAGNIWGMRKKVIPDGADFMQLRDILAKEGGELLVQVLRNMLKGRATAIPQENDPSAPRAPVIIYEDSVIDFIRMTAESIVQRARGINHQKPVVAYMLTNQTLQLHSPSVYLSDDAQALPLEPGTAIHYHPTDSLLIRCQGQSILSVPEVKQEGKNLLRAKQWYVGVRPEMRVVLEEGGTPFVKFLGGEELKRALAKSKE